MNNSVQYNAQGQLVQVQANQSTTVSGVKCPTCGEESNISFEEVREPIMVMMLQAMGGIVAGLSLFFVHYYIAPVGSMELRETAWYSIALFAPTVMLIVSLFVLQVLQLFDVWVKLIIWIFGLCIAILLSKWVINYLMGLPSIGGVQ